MKNGKSHLELLSHTPVPSKEYRRLRLHMCWVSGCNKETITGEGALRLRGGFDNLCDPLYTGFIEIFHSGRWGSAVTALRMTFSSLR